MPVEPEMRFYDVVIIGAGPAGLTAAAWMKLARVNALLIDKQPAPPPFGHADGIESRTFEILDMFRLGDCIWKEANQTIEVSLWKRNVQELRHVFTRLNSSSSSQYCTIYSEATLAQGRVQHHLLDYVHGDATVEVLRNYEPCGIRFENDNHNPAENHSVQLEIQPYGPRLSQPRNLGKKVIQCQYLLACDGAHSWVRNQLDLSLNGEMTAEHWGVIDCVPITDFPDIRRRCIFQLPVGSAMLIPREGRMVRFYVQLSAAPRTKCQLALREELVTNIAEMIKPFSFDTKMIDWLSTYSVSRRLCTQFSVQNRIFLAGDAVHTHSPKAGQGMNTSMQDAFNLGWKIASVVKGVASNRILETYQLERLPVAKRLLEFDKEIYDAITERSSNFDDIALQNALEKENSSASGLSVEYRSNMLIGKENNVFVRGGQIFKAGRRCPNISVLNHFDGRRRFIHDLLNNGQWNLIIFGGDLTKKSRLDSVHNLATSLAEPAFRQEKSHHEGFGGVCLYLVHSASPRTISISSLPSMLIHCDELLGRDYSRVFMEDVSQSETRVVYQDLCIPQSTFMVLVRPDHHIGFCGQFEDVNKMKTFISGFWIGGCPLV